VSPCYEYRDRRADESPEAYGARLAAELEEAIGRLGPDNVIAFVAETVGGATSGCLPPVPGYFRRIRELCDRHGILLILDEVMCGMGRTGTLHACEQDGVVPDLMAIAKGLGGGYQPIGGVLVHERIVDALEKGSGFFHHGHTYLGHPVACAAALAVQKVIQRDGLVDAVKKLGARLSTQLHARFDADPHIGDIRGRGLFMAIELVEDRKSKRPFDPALRLHARILAHAMERGLVVYPMGGTVDGRIGDHVLVAPPFVSTPDDIDEIVRRLGDAVDAAIAEIGVGAVTA
jgi:adenosylmethionine-8-amino-7-oxononanoate aminotransferase